MILIIYYTKKDEKYWNNTPRNTTAKEIAKI